jgi:hypothetical protein
MIPREQRDWKMRDLPICGEYMGRSLFLLHERFEALIRDGMSLLEVWRNMVRAIFRQMRHLRGRFVAFMAKDLIFEEE